jgi:hypothetical protein
MSQHQENSTDYSSSEDQSKSQLQAVDVSNDYTDNPYNRSVVPYKPTIDATSKRNARRLCGNPPMLLTGERLWVSDWEIEYEATETALSKDLEYSKDQKNKDRKSGRMRNLTLDRLVQQGQLGQTSLTPFPDSWEKVAWGH